MTTTRRAWRRAWQWLGSPNATRVAQLVAVAALVLSVAVLAKQDSLTNCLARYNEASAQANAARSQAAESDRLALDAMVGAIAGARDLPPEQGNRAVSTALDTYLAARKQANEDRAAHPLPAPPSQRC